MRTEGSTYSYDEASSSFSKFCEKRLIGGRTGETMIGHIILVAKHL